MRQPFSGRKTVPGSLCYGGAWVKMVSAPPVGDRSTGLVSVAGTGYNDVGGVKQAWGRVRLTLEWIGVRACWW
jgi:hypothetical protein